ncbi:hypothetical protein DYB37_011835 [Aphanomyces astaci]|uniref:Uncharacterized protein n=1 Tax=Aphanomyces astaci TaxID=112090 RepID=A0A397BPZ0_APHAT|nr:hypothetical protein DYB36_012277 [Aphanomyces astaci]RHY79661.1 hypothetical protein DYB31_013033 [Aphanomyces astaci]RHY85420.1 hypothetical protein DYB26_011467 [Aphanomyces astaci]RHY87472.1 hypothetical protein DYB35_009681 [Aphanomyces astaci]RHZ30489.1 hypothetical protein DYB37_011835 [Aphanomyces astaci]
MARPREAAAKNGRKPLGACCSSKRRLLGERPRVLALRDVGLPTWHLTMNRVKLAARVDSCSTSCVGNATSHDDHAIRVPFALEGMAWPLGNRGLRSTLPRRLPAIHVRRPHTDSSGSGRAQTLMAATGSTQRNGLWTPRSHELIVEDMVDVTIDAVQAWLVDAAGAAPLPPYGSIV